MGFCSHTHSLVCQIKRWGWNYWLHRFPFMNAPTCDVIIFLCSSTRMSANMKRWLWCQKETKGGGERCRYVCCTFKKQGKAHTLLTYRAQTVNYTKASKQRNMYTPTWQSEGCVKLLFRSHLSWPDFETGLISECTVALTSYLSSWLSIHRGATLVSVWAFLVTLPPPKSSLH